MGKQRDVSTVKDSSEKENKENRESNAQREVEQERKTNGNPEKKSESPEKPNEVPNLTIVDKSQKFNGTWEELKQDGTRVVHTEADGRYSEMTYNAAGQKTRYRDFNGEEYECTSPGDENANWQSTSNRVQKDGVKITYDEATHKTTLIDNYTGNKVETEANGVETTTFAPSNGKTIRKTSEDGREEWMTLQDANGSVRSMHIVDNKLVEYTDDRGITYKKSECDAPIEEMKDGVKVIKPVYTAEGPNGEKIPGQFTVFGDRNGTVLVRNETLAKEDPSNDQVCRKVRLDGAQSTSNSDGSVRSYKAADGTIIESKVVNKEQKVIDKTIRNTDGSVIEARMVDGQPQSIKQTTPDGQINEYSQMYDNNGEYIGWGNKDGRLVADPTSLADTYEKEKGPQAIQKTPQDVNVEANIEQARNHPVDWTVGGIRMYRNGSWFHEQVKYGGVWDFKSPATRTTDRDGNPIVIKDQMGRPEYEDFGNWHYAVVGKKAGFTLDPLKQEAGAAQQSESVSRPGWGKPGVGGYSIRLGGSGTYGDDPHDAKLIEQGYADADQYSDERKVA